MGRIDRLLELIEDGITSHGGDLGGWTRRADGMLKLFDGRVTLAAELRDAGPAGAAGAVHAHVLATMHEHDDEVLDACLMGVGGDDAALGQIAIIWITCVAGPIRSFLDNKPVCMTCQTGVSGGNTSEGYSEGDYGLRGLRAFVGPSITRGFDNTDGVQSALDDTKPWFRFAAESAAPRRVHLAKATIVSDGKQGWYRELEIDGHDVSLRDPDWPAGVQGPPFGYLTRFAVFEFPRNSAEISRRAELERTIRYFAENFGSFDSVDRMMEEMVRQGFNAEMVHETESISTIAFGRLLFESHGVQYSPTVIRARRDGRVETDVPLLSIPAYCRAQAIGAQLRETLPAEQFQALCLYNAESNAILQALESVGNKLDLSQTTMLPCVVPEFGVSEQTMQLALQMLQERAEQSRSTKRRPWWRLWK